MFAPPGGADPESRVLAVSQRTDITPRIPITPGNKVFTILLPRKMERVSAVRKGVDPYPK